MKTSNTCSLKTFWIGFSDWLTCQTSMTTKEAWVEARQEAPRFSALRVALFFILILFFLIFAVDLAPVFVERSVRAGATTQHVVFVTQWGAVLVTSAILGAMFVSLTLKAVRFSRDMCERGHCLALRHSKDNE